MIHKRKKKADLLFKPTFKKGNFHIRSKKRFSREGIHVFQFGRITDVYSMKSPKLIKNQEKLIYELFLDEGENFIKSLDGYFLIIVHDEANDCSYIYNNRYSSTYCYYHLSKDYILFADAVRPILKKISHKPDVEMEIINLFLNAGYSYSDKTCFKDIFRLIPGYYMKIHKGMLQHVRYYSMNFNRKALKNVRKALDYYEEIWEDSIKRFVINNGTDKLGSTLSGGVDTTWVVYNASKVHDKPVHTYTCEYKYSLFNEVEKARYVTKKCNGIHHTLLVSEDDLDLLPDMIRATEEPVLASALSIYKIFIGAEADTMLSGDGGDNIYGHYFPVGELHRYMQYMPYQIRKHVHKLIKKLSRMTGWERLWELEYALAPFSRKNFYKDFYKNFVSYRHFNKEMRAQLLKKEYQKEMDSEKMLGYIPITRKKFFDNLTNSNFIYGNMQYVSTFHEKFARENGKLFYPPFQSKRIMDFICSLPQDMLFRGNHLQKLTNTAVKRYFQKLALRRHFPKSFVDKQNQPFDQPYHAWFENRPEIVDLLFKRLINRGWYNDRYLDRLYKEHRRQHQHKKEYCQLSNHGYRIMALLVLEIWCIEFIDRYPDEEYIKKKIPLEEYLSI